MIKVLIKDKKWQCVAGIIFIPGEKDVFIIDASGISLVEELNLLKIKTGKVKQISLDKKNEVEREEQGMVMYFSKD